MLAGRTTPAADPARFDDTHARRDDPWGVTTRWYERRKRSLVLGSLPDERYGAVLEIGCSIGVVTSELARMPESTRTPAPTGSRYPCTTPVAGRNPLAGSSAYSRASTAWPESTRSACASVSGSPAATRSCCSTRSTP